MFNHSVPELWYLMGVMQAAGLSFKWFRDNFGLAEKFLESQTGHDAYEYLIQEAEKAPPGSEGLLWLPYLQGERTPHLDANARGLLFGLTARHNRSHVIRSILEGVVYGLRNSLDIIKSLGVKIEEIRLTGGGAKSPLWRQIQADVFNAPVVTINIDEGPAFGAALIAGVGTGVFKSFKQASQRIIKVIEHREPIAENTKIYEKYYRLYNRLYPALKQEFKRIAQLSQ